MKDFMINAPGDLRHATKSAARHHHPRPVFCDGYYIGAMIDLPSQHHVRPCRRGRLVRELAWIIRRQVNASANLSVKLK